MPILLSQISGAVALRALSARRLNHIILASSTILAGFSSVAHAGAPLPVGGSVAAGGASIVQGQNATTVNQTSARAVVNWQSFDVAAGKSVVFNQPDAKSATLNRVTGNTTSTIAGQITSNGAVYLINPNGIAITSTGSVNTAGGFVASTLDIADADFMAGNLKFAGNGASNAVTNAGHIAVGQGAYVALLGGAVSNSGTINVPYGKVGLGSGESIALDLNGNGFMQVAVPTALLTGSNALIDNSGSIAASGGTVQLQAAVVKDAVRNVINMSGSINADSATGDGGTIHLIGGADTANMAGTVTVNGSLSARATGSTGNGGQIETSGATVNFTGVNVDTTSAGGKTGTWLVDPTDLTVDDAAAATINRNLKTSNVSLQTTATTANGPGVQSSGNGDININSSIIWTSGNTLSLFAYNNLYINRTNTVLYYSPAISTLDVNTGKLTSGSLIVSAGNGVAYKGSILVNGDIYIGGSLSVSNGNWSQTPFFNGALPDLDVRDFSFNADKATFLRVGGGDGSSTNPYVIVDYFGLQGIGSKSTLSSNFAVSSNFLGFYSTFPLNPIGTANWNAGKGFVPIGSDALGNVWNGTAFASSGPLGFSGSIDGNNHVISGLTIAHFGGADGLIGYASGATLTNIRLTGVNISGSRADYVGGLIGYGNNVTVNGSSSSGTVSGYGHVGGLIGYASNSSVNASSSAGSVSGTDSLSQYIGGLIGEAINTSVAGSSSSATVSGYSNVGGLIGYSHSGGSIANSSATGAVTGTGPNAGGLVGDSTVNITSSFATGKVQGASYIGGLVGVASGSVGSSFATGSVQNGIYIGGLIGSSTAIVSNSYATGAVNGIYGGGLIGQQTGSSISGSYATGAVTSVGGLYLGGLVGLLSGATLSSSYATGDVKTTDKTGGNQYVGGLVGQATGIATLISQSYATGAVTGDTGTNSGTGGLVGQTTLSANVTQSYASGAVSGGGGDIGGLIGDQGSRIVISQVYATGSVSGGASMAYVGGLIGLDNSTSVDNAWASGAVSGGAILSRGGVAGYSTSAIANSVYWDSYSSGQLAATGPNLGAKVSAVAVTSDPAASSGANYAFNAANYSNLTQADWVFLPNARPILAFQSAAALTPVNGVVTLTTVAQLATINTSAATLAQTYTLSGSFNLGATARSGQAGSFAGVFANGITPIGTDGSGNILNGGAGFSGSFNGGGFTISGLNVNTTSNYAGLFGYSTGNISNLAISGTVTSTANFAGGLVGYQSGGSVSNITSSVNVIGFAGVGGILGSGRNINLTGSSASGQVSGTYEVGGLAGEQVGGTWSGNTSSATITGTGAFAGGLVGVVYGGSLSGSATGSVNGALDVGGLVGYTQSSTSSITNSSVLTGSVSGTGNVGGLVGYSEGDISGSTSSDTVNGNAFAGGLVGRAVSGAISGSSSSGAVTGLNMANSQFLGGFVGYQDATSTISNVSATGAVTSLAPSVNYVGGLVGFAGGTITGSSASGAVGGSSAYNYAGGLVGFQSGAIISTSKATGNVSGGQSVGGLVGYTVSGSVDQSYASGAVSGAGSYAGGLIGFLNAGTITNVYATGGVKGGALYVGGLIGYQLGGSIAQAYATGNVSGGVKMGGLIGYQQAGSLTSGVWDTQATGQTNGFGYQLAGATFTGMGLTTLQSQDFASFNTIYPGFDFTNIWTTPNQAGQNGQSTAAYPTLRNRP